MEVRISALGKVNVTKWMGRGGDHWESGKEKCYLMPLSPVKRGRLAPAAMEREAKMAGSRGFYLLFKDCSDLSHSSGCLTQVTGSEKSRFLC